MVITWVGTFVLEVLLLCILLPFLSQALSHGPLPYLLNDPVHGRGALAPELPAVVPSDASGEEGPPDQPGEEGPPGQPPDASQSQGRQGRLPDASRGVGLQGQLRARPPQEVLHPHRHVYRVFNDVCVRRTPLDPKLLKQDKSKVSKLYDRVLSLCRSAKAKEVEWPLPPTGPAPERAHAPTNKVKSSRFRLEAGGAECGPQSRWVDQAIYLHAGHKITARWPLNPRSLNVGHWMHDSLGPLMVAAVTLNESFARAPEMVILDVDEAMPANAIHAAGILAELFAEAWHRPVPLVRATSLPSTVCMRQLVLPDNVVEVRLSDRLPTPSDDGAGETQAWDPSYGQPGPALPLAKLAVDAFRRRALSSCNISVRERSCIGSAAVFGREGDGKRALRNVGSLKSGLAREGLDVRAGFDFARMPWCETLRTMSSVDLFISLHGASVAFNIFFMQPSAIVLELLPNASYASLLPPEEREGYRKREGHWSMSCPWDYLASLNLVQALSLHYKCLGSRLPPGTEEEGKRYPANYPSDACVPCILDWIRNVAALRKKRGGSACG